MKDRPLVGKKAFCEFLGIERGHLYTLNRGIGVPHALVGNRWLGTTHTLMAWLTDLVKKRARIQYDTDAPAHWQKWIPTEEILQRFNAACGREPRNGNRESAACDRTPVTGSRPPVTGNRLPGNGKRRPTAL